MLAEFWIRTEKYLTFHLKALEYPPFAMLYFLLLRWAEFTFHVGFEKNFVVANYVLLGLHLALLNHVAGRRARPSSSASSCSRPDRSSCSAMSYWSRF